MLPQDQLKLVEILEEHLRGNIPVGLVVRVGLMAEGGFRGIEGNAHPLGVETLARIQQ